MTLFLLRFPLSHFFPSSFIHAAWLQTLTWDIHFHLSPTQCVILSRSLYCSLYLSVSLPLHLLLSNSNWYDISWSSDIAFTFGLFLAGRVLSQCFPSIDQIQVRSCCLISLYVSLGCQNAKEFNQVAAGLSLTKSARWWKVWGEGAVSEPRLRSL